MAAETVPVVAGSVTPPVCVRELSVARTTVPAVDDCTATLPKLMSAVLIILMGVTMVAVALAETVTCANVLVVLHSMAIRPAVNVDNFFIEVGLN
jgi:hypothetical protein